MSSLSTFLRLLCLPFLGSLALTPSSFGQAVAPAQPGSLTSRTADASGIADDATIQVNFPNSPIQAIIPFYTKLTGKKIILDSSLQGEPLKIIAPKPLTKTEAIQFIHATLLLNGYAMIPKDDQTMMLIHHSGGKSPASEGIPVYSSIHDLPDDEQIVHFVMPLSHISPDEASKAFQEVVKLHSYGAITPVTNSSAVIITENSDTIRSIYEIAQVIDVPPAEIANELIPLERSDAERVAEIINEIYAEPEEEAVASNNNTATAQPAQPGAAPAPVPVAASTANTNPTAAKVRVIADRRTNSLLVIARPVDITYIKGLVEKLDQQSGGITFMKRKLSFMNVADFLPVAYDALARDTDIQSDSGSGISGSGNTRRSSSPRGSLNSPSTDAQRNDSGLAGGGFGGGLGGGTGFGSNSNRSLLDDPEQYAAPQSVVVGRTLLIADGQSNSLIVSGSPEHIEVIDQLLAEIDVRPQQIYISTVIGQLSLGQEYNYGFDFLNLLDDFTLRQSRTTTIERTDDGIAITQPPENGTGVPPITPVPQPQTQTTFEEPGIVELPFQFNDFNWNNLNLYGQIGAIGRYVNLLDANRDFKVLSRPSVYTTNNGKAVISSGQRIAVPTQILSNGGAIGGLASTSASIDYRDVVLKLEVVPLINSDDEVTLRIAQINDNIIGEQVISGNTIPTLSTQELVTTITVKNGQTIVLGGLITERNSEGGRGTVFLRRIPVIKHLFGTTTKEISREELLIFIQPNIINNQDSLDTPNQLEAGRSELMQETLQFGATMGDIPRALPYEEE